MFDYSKAVVHNGKFYALCEDKDAVIQVGWIYSPRENVFCPCQATVEQTVSDAKAFWQALWTFYRPLENIEYRGRTYTPADVGDGEVIQDDWVIHTPDWSYYSIALKSRGMTVAAALIDSEVSRRHWAFYKPLVASTVPKTTEPLETTEAVSSANFLPAIPTHLPKNSGVLLLIGGAIAVALAKLKRRA